MRILRGFMSCLLLFMVYYPISQANSVQDTKQRIAKLDQKIQSLHGDLNAKQRKQKILDNELASIEKAIGEQSNQLSALTDKLKNLISDIKKREQRIQTLTEQQSRQQDHLIQHLKTRYQIDTMQPLKWFINRSRPEMLSRTLIYYQYLISSRKQLISNLHETQKTLCKEQQTLQRQHVATETLQQSLQLQQNKLEEDKHYRKNVVDRLQKEINVAEKKLANYQKNRDELSQLLQKLYRESKQKNTPPFYSMRHKLPAPVQVRNHRKAIKLNQGVLFPAPEGHNVRAVFPGKIIFSDWLKGYGLLLILDHGQGYMTLYAHNLSLLKKKGEMASQNEIIATVGHSGGLRENGLYFEVRYRGKAVSAQEWLLY